MLWKILPWLIAAIFIAVAVGAGDILTASVYNRKTSLKRSGQFWGFLFWFSIPYAVVLYFVPTSYKDVLQTLLYATWSVLLIVLMIAQLQGSRRIRMESTVLDLGPGAHSAWLLLIGAFLLSWAVALMTICIANSRTTVETLAQFVLGMLAGVLALYKGSSKTIFTEAGIFSSLGYTEWSNIRSYEWEDSKLPILKLKVTNSWVTFNTAWMNIPVSEKDAVQALLLRKLSKPEHA